MTNDGPRPPHIDPVESVVNLAGENYQITQTSDYDVDVLASLTITDQNPPQEITYTVEVHSQQQEDDKIVGTYTIVVPLTGTGSGSMTVTLALPGGWFVYQVVSITTINGTTTFGTTAGQFLNKP